MTDSSQLKNLSVLFRKQNLSPFLRLEHKTVFPCYSDISEAVAQGLERVILVPEGQLFNP